MAGEAISDQRHPFPLSPIEAGRMVESAQFDYSRRIARAVGGDVIEEAETRIIRTGLIGIDRIYTSDLTGPGRARATAALAMFAPLGTPAWLMHYEYQDSAASPAWLEARGLRSMLRWKAMVADLDALRPADRPADRFHLAETANDADFADVMAITAEVFDLRGEKEAGYRAATQAIGRGGGIHFFLARAEDGSAAGAATLGIHPGGVAGIYWVGVREPWRNRGLGAQLTRALLAAARAHGCRWATLQAVPWAQSVYRRIGFNNICGIGVYG